MGDGKGSVGGVGTVNGKFRIKAVLQPVVLLFRSQRWKLDIGNTGREPSDTDEETDPLVPVLDSPHVTFERRYLYYSLREPSRKTLRLGSKRKKGSEVSREVPPGRIS